MRHQTYTNAATWNATQKNPANRARTGPTNFHCRPPPLFAIADGNIRD